MERDEERRTQAVMLWEEAYRVQMDGRLGDAIQLYKRSIDLHPTAEAYTFLGWAYSQIDLLDTAIELCEQAIEIDPDFGNPYNDIGAYLIEQERWEEAIPWLQKAIAAPRYASPQFAYMNLGRVYEHLGQWPQALAEYDRALSAEPLYMPAEWARRALLGKMN